MSNFLAGVVRRGAGLASPVVIRPATGPEQIGSAMPKSGVEAADPAPPGSPSVQEGTPDSPRVPPAAMPSPVETILRVGPVATTTTEKSFPVLAEPPPGELRTESPRRVPNIEAKLQDRSEKIVVQNVPQRSINSASEGPVLPRNVDLPNYSGAEIGRSEKLRSQPEEVQARPVDQPVPVTPLESRQSPVSDRVELLTVKATTAGMTKREPEPTIALKTPARQSPALPTEKRTPTESRNIQVKIGKVEIRSTQAAPRPQASRPPAKGGFDDFALMRNYLDRSQR